MTDLARLEDLAPDTQNANEGTLRGAQLLEESVASFGGARSIVVDADGNVIAGNKTLETAVDRGLALRVVPSDGTTLVVVQRTDLDARDPKTRLLAYLDNRASELGLSWDKAQLERDLGAGVQFNGMFTPTELDVLLDALAYEQIAVHLTFETPAQAEQWAAFVRVLDARYAKLPASETPKAVSGTRLDAWVTAQMQAWETTERDA